MKKESTKKKPDGTIYFHIYYAGKSLVPWWTGVIEALRGSVNPLEERPRKRVRSPLHVGFLVESNQAPWTERNHCFFSETGVTLCVCVFVPRYVYLLKIICPGGKRGDIVYIPARRGFAPCSSAAANGGPPVDMFFDLQELRVRDV